MSMSEIIKQIILFLDKTDKILVVFGALFLVLGADFKIDIKGYVVNFDKKQVLYFRAIGAILVIMSVLPAILGYWFRPVTVKDLVELRSVIGDTQASINIGLESPNRSEGENSFHARKEMRYANTHNVRAATKLDGMIKALSP